MHVTVAGDGNLSGFGDQLSSQRNSAAQHSQLNGRRILGSNPQCEEKYLHWVKGSDSPGPVVHLPVSDPY